MNQKPPKRGSYVNFDKNEHKKGDTLEIPCIASGIPEPKMMWINVEDQKIVSKDKNLYIETVRPSDTGAYTCVAKVTFQKFFDFRAKIAKHIQFLVLLTQKWPFSSKI